MTCRIGHNPSGPEAAFALAEVLAKNTPLTSLEYYPDFRGNPLGNMKDLDNGLGVDACVKLLESLATNTRLVHFKWACLCGLSLKS